MALPKLESPTYTLEVPSTGEKLKFRPFLVKEQKILMIAEESKDDNQIYNAMETLINSCTFGKIDVKAVNLFDVEYIFLQLRAKSVGEHVELNLLCPDDNETRVPTKIDLTKMDIDVGEGHTDKISITDNITMYMKYPTLDNIRTIDKKSTEVDSVFSIMRSCIYEVHDGDTIYSRIDISDKDIDDFVDQFNTTQFESIMKFFDTMPKVKMVIDVTNPNTKVTSKVTLEGMNSFLA
jgi:hypothetical protein|tara:strand:+ start:610 stop:1317 length:708 start_codon:yes stop_codon:yes gene_type:complete